MADNLCDNALDLVNRQLKVENNWPVGTYCQWLISAQDNNGYVILEFQKFNVGNTIAFKEILNYVIYQRYILDRGVEE